MKASQNSLTVLAGALAFAGFAQVASAAGQTVTSPQVTQERVETTGPNRALLHSGIWIFGLSYIPAVIVATESDRHGDKNLYVPVAGPWMDLATRTNCPASADCNNETANQAFIIIDGVFQALGALNFAGAFLFPETRTTSVSTRARYTARLSLPSLRVTPARITTNAFGLVAIGAF